MPIQKLQGLLSPEILLQMPQKRIQQHQEHPLREILPQVPQGLILKGILQ